MKDTRQTKKPTNSVRDSLLDAITKLISGGGQAGKAKKALEGRGKQIEDQIKAAGG